MAEHIHITITSDKAYKRQLAVTLRSIATTHQPGSCTVVVLHAAIPERDRALIDANLADSLKVNWVNIDLAAVKDLRFPSFATSTAFARLLIPGVMPEVERTIYLDSDIIVLRPLTGLWECDLKQSLVGAVRDATKPWAAGPVGETFRDLGLEPDTPYFNAGVLLVPVDAWRREGVAKAAIDLVREKKFTWADQDGLNAVIQGRWHELPRCWNVQSADYLSLGTVWATMREQVEAALADPAIIHYTSPGKPWWPGSAHPMADRWFEQLDQTPWPGLRRPAKRPAAREAASRVMRAGRILLQGELAGKTVAASNAVNRKTSRALRIAAAQEFRAGAQGGLADAA
jgi:lipopolysaccharide biosynthesis glycosyltransferase